MMKKGEIAIYALVIIGLLFSLFLVFNHELANGLRYTALLVATLVILIKWKPYILFRVTKPDTLYALGILVVILAAGIFVPKAIIGVPEFNNIGRVGASIGTDIVAPIAEEMFFRVALLTALAALGVLLILNFFTGVVGFTLWHWTAYEGNSGLLIGAVIFAVVGGAVVIWRKNAYPSTAAHVGYNSIVDFIIPLFI